MHLECIFKPTPLVAAAKMSGTQNASTGMTYAIDEL